jgi:hypothetical protein
VTAKAKKIRLSGRRAKRIQRYAVFSGDQFYPNGGWRDYRSSHATLEAARQAPAPGDWVQIIDLHTGKFMFEKDYK